VLDPFAGSGTTLIAAEKTRRRAAVMEIDPLYVDAIVRRWEAFTAKRPSARLQANLGRFFTVIFGQIFAYSAFSGSHFSCAMLSSGMARISTQEKALDVPRAAYPRPCSSNASGLHGRNSARIGESARAFKGIICDDVSEFESDMPSHAVWSVWAIS
jgi:DNA methylase